MYFSICFSKWCFIICTTTVQTEEEICKLIDVEYNEDDDKQTSLDEYGV